MKFRIENMTCGGCARSVTRTIQKLDPEAQVEIDVDRRFVEVRSETPSADFAAALAEVGYPAVEAA